MKEINEQIVDAANALSDLLEQRSDLNNKSGFYSNTLDGVCETLDAAASSNYHYQFYVQENFRRLYHQFDWKYWPKFSDLLDELARDAYEAEVLPSNKVTEAATTGSRASLKDYARALHTHIDNNLRSIPGFCRSDFKLSDSAVASLMNCALNLEPDEMKDAAYVKRFRQGERERLSKALE